MLSVHRPCVVATWHVAARVMARLVRHKEGELGCELCRGPCRRGEHFGRLGCRRGEHFGVLDALFRSRAPAKFGVLGALEAIERRDERLILQKELLRMHVELGVAAEAVGVPVGKREARGDGAVVSTCVPKRAGWRQKAYRAT